MKTKKRVSKIKAIIFDSNGVLFLAKGMVYGSGSVRGYHSIGIHEYMAGKLKINLDQWFDAIDTAYADSIEGQIKRDKAVEKISENLHISQEKFEKLMKGAYRKFFKKNEGLYEIVHELKKKEFIIGLLSDQWHLSKEALLSKKNLKPFEVSIVSCDVGFRKPNPEIYKLLIKELKKKDKTIKNSEILFIDNQTWNLKPAEKLGIKTILFKNNKDFIKEMKRKGIECNY